MAFSIDITDAANVPIGSGPITTASRLAVTTKLDAAGTISFSMPTPAAVGLFPANTPRYVRARVERGDTIVTYRGIVKGRNDDSEGMELQLSGSDLLGELLNGHVGRLLLSDGAGGPQSAVTVLASVLSGSGWTATGTPSEAIYYQFGDETYLAALNKIAELTGDHWRESLTVTRQIEWLPTNTTVTLGFDSQPSGLRATDSGDPNSLATTDDVALIVGGLQRQVDMTQLITRVYPRGAGNAGAQLYLNATTRFSAAGAGDYVDGDYTLHLDADPSLSYIKHTVNDAAGSIGKPETFRDIAAIGETATDDESAANALFDAALVSLRRHIVEQTAYRLTLTKVRMALPVGSTLHVVCRHFVDGVGWMDIDKHLMVLETRPTWTADGDEAMTVEVTE